MEKNTIRRIRKYLLFLNIFKKISRTGLILSILFFLSIQSETLVLSESSNISYLNQDNLIYLDIVRKKLTENLVNEVKIYINSTVPNSKIDGKILVELCLKHNMDITFVLSQGIIESTLGTKGKAAVTNSVWNVGTYDDGQIRHTYKTANESIEPFLKLIRKSYLGDKKQISDLIKDNSYKSIHGHRYASSRSYESYLRNAIRIINKNSKIKLYQDIINLDNEQLLLYCNSIK